MKYAAVLFLILGGVLSATNNKHAPKRVSAIDKMLEEAKASEAAAPALNTPGSLYSDAGQLANPGRDLRATQVGDLITILVSDQASAVSKGVSNSSRKSSTANSITAALGALNTAGRTSPLLSTTGNTQLQGTGQTSRDSTLTATVSARVTHVLANGCLIVEGTKQIAINSEQQVVHVRGVLRPSDLAANNTIASDRLADLEVQINGRGVVNDAVKRPFFLYRLLLGLVPF